MQPPAQQHANTYAHYEWLNWSKIFIDIYRDFGVPGSIAYLGGALLLFFFPRQKDLVNQSLFMLSGLFLLGLATYISRLRIKSQRERENALIEMAKNSCNRLAEQLGKGLSKKQVDSISQKIRQIHRDVALKVFDQAIEK